MNAQRTLLTCLFLLVSTISAWAAGPVQVRSYTRADGTFVRGYTRSLPGTGSSSGGGGGVGSSSSIVSDYANYSDGGDYNGPPLVTRGTDPNVILAKSGKQAFRATRELFAKLHTGMNAQDVYALLGPPSKFNSGEWSYDGIGWLGFSATDRVSTIRATEAPKPVPPSLSTGSSHGVAVKHCAGKTRGGSPCPNLPEAGSIYCKQHKSESATPHPKP